MGTVTVTWFDSCKGVFNLEVPVSAIKSWSAARRLCGARRTSPRRQTRDEALKETDDQKAGLRAESDPTSNVAEATWCGGGMKRWER